MIKDPGWVDPVYSSISRTSGMPLETIDEKHEGTKEEVGERSQLIFPASRRIPLIKKR
jgi:hypothetical protein